MITLKRSLRKKQNVNGTTQHPQEILVDIGVMPFIIVMDVKGY